MKPVITFVFFIVFSFSQAQSPLDTIKQFNYKKHYALILKESKNEKSDYAYTKQLKKFTNDETQSNFEVLCMLIGFSDNVNFSPYRDILTVDKEIFDLNEKEKYAEAIEYGNSALEKNPFMIKVIREVSYAYNKTGNNELAEKFMIRTGKIYNAMFSSSTVSGTDIEAPFFSLGPKDGQYFIKYFMQSKLGDMGSGYDANGYFIDILKTTVEGNPATFYFNINHAMKTLVKE